MDTSVPKGNADSDRMIAAIFKLWYHKDNYIIVHADRLELS
jgi:hypothetical protein